MKKLLFSAAFFTLITFAACQNDEEATQNEELREEQMQDMRNEAFEGAEDFLNQDTLSTDTTLRDTTIIVK